MATTSRATSSPACSPGRSAVKNLAVRGQAPPRTRSPRATERSRSLVPGGRRAEHSAPPGYSAWTAECRVSHAIGAHIPGRKTRIVVGPSVRHAAGTAASGWPGGEDDAQRDDDGEQVTWIPAQARRGRRGATPGRPSTRGTRAPLVTAGAKAQISAHLITPTATWPTAHAVHGARLALL